MSAREQALEALPATAADARRLGLHSFSGLRGLAAAALTALAVAIIAARADFAAIGDGLGALTDAPLLVIGAVAAYSAAFLLRSIAWRALLGGGISVGPLHGIIQASLFLNHLLPIKAGEVARAYLATRRGIPAAAAATTTAAARFLDLLVLLLITAALLPFAERTPGNSIWIPLVVAAIAMAGLAGSVTWLRVTTDDGFVPSPLRSSAAKVRTALASLSTGRLLTAFLWTAPSWLLEGVTVYAIGQAADIDIALHVAVGATAFTVLFQAIQVTPGGIGIYEASMTGVLSLYGVPVEEALTLAVIAHAFKFAYSWTIGLSFGASEWFKLSLRSPLAAVRGSATDVRGASRFEIVAARAWNVLNEGKPFTPVFTIGILILLTLPHAGDLDRLARSAGALLALLPLFVVFFRYDFPLKLRLALWAYLDAYLVLFLFFDPVATALVLGLYFAFTVVFWGTIYYHLRIGTRWTNFLRFWRLVIENPDPTSGNFLEQAPKCLLIVLMFQNLADGFSTGQVIATEVFVGVIAVTAVLLHQWFFRWVPGSPQTPTRLHSGGRRTARRFIAIVIDGCRADRLIEAKTPFIDRLRAEGTDFTDMQAVYPARTVTCFSSMLTGAPPRVHGMHSNFVPRLGVRCDSLFTSLRRQGLKAKLVGIAHLIDAFGHEDVSSVTAVIDNDEIDYALSARGRQVMEGEQPDVLILQLLSVDQTGHARGSYNSEYLHKIEVTDQIIADFLGWCETKGYLEDATVLITADHGQGIGIGGHGHFSDTEVKVPCIFWGAGVPAGVTINETRSLVDIAPTISYFLGAEPPRQSVGQVLIDAGDACERRPTAIIIPAHNEAENLPAVLARIPRASIADPVVIIVDDGSSDETAAVARRSGADLVVSHETNRGLGAALRTGLETARSLNARAAVYLDADGEYDAAEIPGLLAPIEAGQVDYVLGSRFMGDPKGMRLSRRVQNRIASALLSFLCGRWLSDGQTGFRAFSSRALEVAEIVHDYNYAQVLTLDLVKKGMTLTEVPISYHRRRSGRSFIKPEYVWRVTLGVGREILSQ